MPASAVTVKASFVKDETPVDTGLPFADVKTGDWYYEAVKYVYENNLMVGTADDTFSPGATLSRAMVSQILYNLEGQPAVTEGNTFTDSGTHWAAKAIAWAQKTGVVSGYENNTFQPNKAVKREELAQMLYNYVTYKKITLPALGDLSKFPDGSKVSSWAQNAMSWATGLLWLVLTSAAGLFLFQLTEQGGAVLGPEAMVINVAVIGRKQGPGGLLGLVHNHRRSGPIHNIDAQHIAAPG